MRDWAFENDGPVRLNGDWEVIPEATLEGDELITAPSSGDFVSLPWGDAHHTTRLGHDVDASKWLQLRVRVRAPEPSMGFALEIVDSAIESFFAECRSREGAAVRVPAGIASPRDAERFIEGLWPGGDLAVTGESTCVVTVPRAVLSRVRFLAAPQLERADLALRRKLERSMLVVTNLAMMGTFVVFAAILVATEMRNAVARWSLAFGMLMLLRVVITNRGFFFPLHGKAWWGELPWWRAEYVAFWLLFIAFFRYGESLVSRRLPLLRALEVVLGALALLAVAASYDISKRLLPIGHVVAVVGIVTVTSAVFRATSTRAIRLARAGLVVVLVGAVGAIIAVARTGIVSSVFELLVSTEPLFQMAVLAAAAQEARKKSADLARATQHFVPRQFLEELGHADVTTAKLGDAASRHVTVLFADIRNFTSMSERLSPAETFAFLNACLSRIGPHVRAQSGFVDKYIGDAIMALFPREPADAVRAAVAMQGEIAASNARHPERPPLAIGVGIHVGNVMMGTIGEAERFEATVISDAVNLTARLESLTKVVGCTILISEDVYATLDEGLRTHTRRLGTFVVKGKAQPVTLYEVFASDPEALRETKLGTRERFDAMFDAFASERIEGALAIVSELRDSCPDDGPANWWFMRLVKESAAGDDAVPSSRGIVRLDEK